MTAPDLPLSAFITLTVDECRRVLDVLNPVFNQQPPPAYATRSLRWQLQKLANALDGATSAVHWFVGPDCDTAAADHLSELPYLLPKIQKARAHDAALICKQQREKSEQ